MEKEEEVDLDYDVEEGLKSIGEEGILMMLSGIVLVAIFYKMLKKKWPLLMLAL